ncbi:uncharacterized protein LAESUDRAFT_728783 [Laetiporus sulphureus 93-53]|uniref:Uncharacterized protein n=1 Tax=Laetiporus sulphureus 93-53 TaxID=1314785 RepID=A0A165CYM6_9APHY|nr:uncharacterized protein LAESUDRAFT_728783 [Laetiporus sulphureus 93-53]KZT03760.1 hypothetical protein LAESUDRAFT_728783 [Laetiporus sulphureus 93-53]
MGLFGVTLDTRVFRKDDRLGATVALGRELARTGNTIDWLGAGLLLPPCRQLSSFPAFPITTVSGKATLSTISGIREVSTFYNSFEGMQWLCDLPLVVSMDDGGYTTIRAQTLRVLSLTAGPDANQPHLRTLSTNRGTYSCKIHDYNEMSLSETNRHDDFIPAENSRVLMVNLGELKQPTMASFARFLDPWAGRAILVKEHAPERFHRIAWCEYNTYNARNGLFEEACGMDDVSIGGPDPLCDVH